MMARDLMRTGVLMVRRDMSVAELCDTLQEAHVSSAPVVDDRGFLVGIVSKEDILYGSMGRASRSARGGRGNGGRAGTRPRGPDGTQRVRDIMTAPAVSAAESTDVADLCRLMWKLHLHHIPIVRRGKLQGMVSSMDVCRAIANKVIPI